MKIYPASFHRQIQNARVIQSVRHQFDPVRGDQLPVLCESERLRYGEGVGFAIELEPTINGVRPGIFVSKRRLTYSPLHNVARVMNSYWIDAGAGSVSTIAGENLEVSTLTGAFDELGNIDRVVHPLAVDAQDRAKRFDVRLPRGINHGLVVEGKVVQPSASLSARFCFNRDATTKSAFLVESKDDLGNLVIHIFTNQNRIALSREYRQVKFE